jgi:nucleotide-binding universal stress UspA family protein
MAGFPTRGRPVVIGFDGSDEALRAVEAAGRLLPGSAAVVVHVHSAAPLAPLAPPPPGAPTLPPLPGAAPIDDAEVERIAKRVADAGVAAADAAGLRARPALCLGDGASDVAHAIADAAREHDAAVIVVGSHGRSGVKALLLGSVSRALLGISSIPVLVVPPAGDE